MNLMKSIILVILVFITIRTYSQKGYNEAYYTTEMDTIYGVALMGKSQMSFTFYKEGSNEIEKFSPHEAISLKIKNGKYFISYEIENSFHHMDKYFLECLVDGDLDLLYLANGKRYFLKKDANKLFEVKNKLKKKVQKNGKIYQTTDYGFVYDLKNYIADAPELSQSINNYKKIERKELIEISIKYNKEKCLRNDCINYRISERHRTIELKVEILSGLNKLNTSYAPYLGSLLYFSIPKMSKRIYLRTGLTYASAPKNEQIGDEIKYSVNVPVSLMYVIGDKKFKPIFATGFSLGFHPLFSFEAGFLYSFNSKVEVKLSGSIGSINPVELYREILDKNLAHTISFGVIFPIGSKVK